MKPPVQYAMTPPRVDAPKVGKMKPVVDQPVGDMKPFNLDEALRYYLGPTGIPDRLAAVNQMFNPVETLGGSMKASQKMLAPDTAPIDRVRYMGDMLSGIGGFVAPMVAAAKVGAPAVAGVVDAFTGLSTAPATQAAKTTATDFALRDDGALKLTPRGDYVGSHTAPALEPGATMDNPADIWGNDIYSRDAMRYFGTGDAKLDKDSFAAIQAARDNPDADVMIYRAVPMNAPDDINAGDWVTTSPRYARDHGEANLDGDYRIVTEQVKAKELATDGNSVHEWGWWPSQDRIAAETPVAPMRPVTPAQDVARLLSEGRASDVTEEMRAAADPQEMWNLYKTGATGMDMPVDHASRMARAKDMGHDTDAYHASRSDADFAAFRPGARGSTYFAPTPNGAVSGASGQALEMAGSAPGDQSVRFVMPTKVRSQDVKGLTVNNDAFAALPDVITDESTIKAIAGDVRKAGLEYWDDAYEAVRFGDSYRYYKRDAPALSYQDIEPGKDAFGYRLGSFNTGSDESGLALANTVGKRGFLVADEGGSSIVAGPNMPVRSRFAIFDPRLKHLANLSAAGVGAAYLAPDERGIRMGQ